MAPVEKLILHDTNTYKNAHKHVYKEWEKNTTYFMEEIDLFNNKISQLFQSISKCNFRYKFYERMYFQRSECFDYASMLLSF